MNPSFNLIHEPWIPCTPPDGRTVELSLRETLAGAHELRGIQGESPLVTAALYRLLLAVLHSALRGPQSSKDWAILWAAGKWNMAYLDAYLERWQDRLYLFHPEYPFYQSPDERVKPKSITLLIHGLVVSDTLFDHESADTTVAYPPAKAARALVASQTFGLGGACDPSQKLYYSDGTLARGIVFFLEGNTLFETLALNLIKYSEDSPQRIPSKPSDKPAWEMAAPFTPLREVPLGYLDYLTWQNRRIFLFPEPSIDGIVVRKVTVSPGLRWHASLRDPMKHYSKDKEKGYKYFFFSEERALWRDSSTFIRLKTSELDPPENIQWLGTLVKNYDLEPSLVYRISVLGMASVPGQAKIDFYREEHLPLPLVYLEQQEYVEELSTALEWTEKTRNSLWGAINTFATLIIAPTAYDENGRRPDKKDVNNITYHWGVERNYWGALEVPFLALVEHIPQDPTAALADWQITLQRTAWKTFRQAERLAGTSPAALKAAVRASGQLAGGLAKLFPKT